QQCGKPLAAAVPPAATVMLSGSTSTTRVARQQHLELSRLFGGKARLIIGRAPDCDIVLAHPSVSRYHARVERRGDGLYLADLSGAWTPTRRRCTRASRRWSSRWSWRSTATPSSPTSPAGRSSASASAPS